jgi:Cysteine-rich CWC
MVTGDRSVVAREKPRQKICEGCGRLFSCSAGNCWCGGIELDSDIRLKLRTRFSDCLCRSCLMRESETEVAHPAPS